MRIINVDVGEIEEQKEPLLIGMRGETEVSEIQFDISSLIETYGEGTVTMLAKRSGDEYPYVITSAEQDVDTVTWTVTNIDTANPGFGKCELWYYVDTALAKTIVYRTFIRQDIGGDGVPPDPYESWLEELTELANDAAESATDAEAARDDAVRIVREFENDIIVKSDTITNAQIDALF